MGVDEFIKQYSLPFQLCVRLISTIFKQSQQSLLDMLIEFNACQRLRGQMFWTFNILWLRTTFLLRGQTLAAERMSAGEQIWKSLLWMKPFGAETALKIIEVVNIHIKLTIIYYDNSMTNNTNFHHIKRVILDNQSKYFNLIYSNFSGQTTVTCTFSNNKFIFSLLLIYIIKDQLITMDSRLKGGQFRNGSSFYSSKVGLFTTLAQSQEEEIKKSRIEHLPSHQRFDLSNKLEFVVVFQTMEIERLSTEIQALRVKLKASERQIRNYSNYEVQIKQLTENCFQLEEEHSNYQNQVEKMSLACNELYQQLTDAKRQQEREVDELKREHAKKNDQLARDNQKLADQLKNLEEQIQKKIENERQTEAKNKTISQELVRLNQMLFQNQNQLSNLKQQQKQKGDELNKNVQDMKRWQQSVQNQIEKRDDKLNAYETQNKDLNGKLNQLKNNIQGINQELNLKNQELTVKENQNKQLWSNLSAIYEAISAEKERSVQMGKYIQNLKSIILVKSAQVQKVKDYLVQYHQDMETSAKRQNQLIATVENYEKVMDQINEMREEIFNMKNAITEKQDQLLGKQQYITELTIENKELFHKNQALDQNCQRVNQAFEQMENHLQNQRQNTEKQRRQKINFQSQKQQLQRELATVKAEGLIKEDLKRQIQSLKQNCKIQQNYIQSINNRFSNLQTAIKILKDQQEKLKQHEKNNQILRQQLQESISLNQQLLQSVGARNKQIDCLFQENYRISRQKMMQSTKLDDFDMKNTSSSTKNIPAPFSPALGPLSSSRASLDSNFGRDRFSSGNYFTQKQPNKNTLNSQFNFERYPKSRSTLGDLSQANKTSPSHYLPNRDSNMHRQSYLTNRDNKYGDFLRRQKRQ